jgi:nitrite reductase/ring-hydroxylating ferredoxin subunit
LESGYIKIAEKSEIPVGKMKKFVSQGKEILIANVNGNFYAISNKCTHAGGDLSQGTLEGNIVTCPKHKSKFDVTTGKVVSPPKMGLFHLKIKDAQSYTLKIENENILIKI